MYKSSARNNSGMTSNKSDIGGWSSIVDRIYGKVRGPKENSIKYLRDNQTAARRARYRILTKKLIKELLSRGFTDDEIIKILIKREKTWKW